MPVKQPDIIVSAYERLRKKIDHGFGASVGDFAQKRNDFKRILEQTSGIFRTDFPKNRSSVEIVRAMRKLWRNA